MVSWCPSCGNQVSAGWRFCRSCGARLDEAPGATGEAGADVVPGVGEPTAPIPVPAIGAEELAASVEAPAPRRRRRWLRVTVLVVGLLALLGGGSAGTWVYLETREDLEATRDELRRTRDDLAATEEDLDVTRFKLERAEEQNRELERNVRRLRTELLGVRGTLSEAQERLELQAGQIEDLRDCLNGVSLAFDSVLYGDYRGAANALIAVESACQAAFALF